MTVIDSFRMFSVSRSLARGGLAVVAVGLATAALAGCGGSQPTAGDPSVASLLADIPSTPQTRADIVINNLEAVRAAAGLPATISIRDLTGRELAALERAPLAAGTPLGTDLLAQIRPALVNEVGYDPLRLTAELGVGRPGAEISVVDGSFKTAAVARALTRYGWTKQGGSANTYAGPVNLRSPLGPMWSSLRRIAVSPSRLAGVGVGVNANWVAAVINHRPVHQSLASDPQVKTALGMLGPSDAIEIGTDLVSGGVAALAGPSATPLERQQLLGRLGFRNLPSPTFGGYALRTTGAWRTVTVYRSARDAARAAPLIAGALRHGTDPVTHGPYSKLVKLLSVDVHGDVVVTNLAASSRVLQMIERADLPQFF